MSAAVYAGVQLGVPVCRESADCTALANRTGPAACINQPVADCGAAGPQLRAPDRWPAPDAEMCLSRSGAGIATEMAPGLSHLDGKYDVPEQSIFSIRFVGN